MVFEHRNYLPTMFISLPVVYGFTRLMQFCESRRAGSRKFFVFIGILVVVLLAVSTFLRNGVWQNEANLYWASIQHNPSVSRSYVNYGVYLVDHGQAAQAIPYFKQAIANGNFHRWDEEENAHFSLANAYLGMEDFDNAIAKTLENIRNYPENQFYRGYLMQIYLLMGDFDSAENVILEMLQNDPDSLSLNLAMANLLQERQNYTAALPYWQHYYAKMEKDDLAFSGSFVLAAQNIGICHILQQDYDQARSYLYQALTQRTAQDSVFIILWIVGLDLIQGQETNVQLTDFLNSDAARPFIAEEFSALAAQPVTEEFMAALKAFLQQNGLLSY